MTPSIDLSPEEFRRLAHAAADVIADHMAALQNDTVPVRQPVPQAVRGRLSASPFESDPRSPDDLLRQVREEIFAYPMGNGSKRFFAWVNSTPAPLGVLGDFLAAGLDAAAAGGDHAATYVEHGVLRAIEDLFRFPRTAGALLTSGGSAANLIGLAAMRQRFIPDIRRTGLVDAPRLVIYTSTQGHSCLQKAVELLGMGTNHLRKLPVDADQRLDVRALRSAIRADRAAGLTPACVAASAGTVNSGAIDPLAAIAEVCAEEGLWLHVDGAYGGVGILAREVQPLYEGIERADSLAVDPHKWLYMPIECGCALVKDAELLRAAFSVMPPYLTDDRELPWFSEYGPQQTRGFKALKLWLVMHQIGLEGYRTLIERDLAMARRLRERIAARPDFEIVTAGPLSITCFRYLPANAAELNDEAIDALNRERVRAVQRSGEAWITTTEIDGRTVIRACIVNFRMQESDLDRLLVALAQAPA